MKQLSNYLTGRFKTSLAIMSILTVCLLMSTTQLRSWGAHKRVITNGAGFAFLGLVATFKKNKTWETMDENSQKFAEGMDIVLKDLALKAIDEEKMDEKLKAFSEEAKKTAITTEQIKAFEETEEAVKGMAAEIKKLKDMGFEAIETQSFASAFTKAIKENEAALLAIKGNEKAGVVMEFKAAAALSTGNVSANTVANMPGAAATMMPGIVSAPRNEPFILDFVDNGTVSTPTIQWFNKVNREDGTAMVAEGALKPLSDFEIVGETATVKKIAHSFNVSEEAITDIPALLSEINGEGITSLKLGIEDQVLNGDGTGNNLKGILAYAGGYSLPALNNTTMSANEYDAILAAHTQLQLLNHTPNAVFVHPTTRYKMRTTKDANNNYIIPPSADANAMNVDGLPVIAKNQIAAGKMLMGDFKKSHVRFLLDITIRAGYHGTDFRENRISYIMEARLTHFIRDVETSAFIEDDFSVIMAALETA